MANRPYQEKVDQFLADYQDKFLPTLITGKGTPESPYTNMEGPEPAIPMSKEQGQFERDKMLASSIHPDTFSKVLDVMKGVGKTALGTGEYLGLGMGYLPQRGQEAIESGLGIEPTKPPRWSSQRIGERMEELLPGGPSLRPITETALGTVGYRFAPPTLADIQAAIPPDFMRGGNVINMAPGPTGAFEVEKPVPSGGFDWRGELAKQGTWSVGPERFFAGGREVPAGTPGAVGGDQLARERMSKEGGSAIPLSAMGEAPIPRTYNLRLPDGSVIQQTERPISTTGGGGEVSGYEMPGEIRTALQGIQKILMQPSGAIYSPSGRQAFAGGYRPHQINALENFAGTLEKMAATGAGYQTKMVEIGAEKPYREAMGDYYRRMAGVHEKALPGEEFARYATGMHALSEAERPHAFAPNSAVYQGAKLLGYVPEKPEAIHPIIRDVINKSMMTDPSTGMQTGFDIRGARQKIGFMAPWLKAQGIDIPREAYKMTRPEFMSEQKAWVSKLPKKERAKYTPQYIEQLWGEYWGKD